jgi:hypothetical protein
MIIFAFCPWPEALQHEVILHRQDSAASETKSPYRFSCTDLTKCTRAHQDALGLRSIEAAAVRMFVPHLDGAGF